MTLNEQETVQLVHLCLDMGEQMIQAGAEVNRVEDTLTRMGKAYGALETDVFVITSSIIITMHFPNGTELTQTRRMPSVSNVNFARLEKLNALSRTCSTAPLSIDALRHELEKQETIPAFFVYASRMLGAGSFAVFFGGTLYDGLAAALFAVLICYLQRHFSKLCPTPVVFNLFTALISGVGIALAARMVPALHMDKIMIGDIMLLIPGLAMTNAVRDILMGDTISGIMRLIESLLWAVALACGFMAAIWLTGGIA